MEDFKSGDHDHSDDQADESGQEQVEERFRRDRSGASARSTIEILFDVTSASALTSLYRCSRPLYSSRLVVTSRFRILYRISQLLLGERRTL